jgi:hypothetical protein
LSGAPAPVTLPSPKAARSLSHAMSLPQSPAARAALERARHEARSLGHEFLGTEHVLLGLLHDPSPELAFVLSQ